MTVWAIALLPLGAAMLAPFSALTTLLLLPLTPGGLRVGYLRRPLSWLMLGWLVWLPLSLVWSMAPGLSLPQMAVLICLPLGWLAGVALHARGELAASLERLLPWLLLILTAWGLLQGPDTPAAKPMGPFNDPNAFAALLNLLLLPLLARYLASDLAAGKAWWRTAHLALLASAGFVLFLTASRGATLALMAVLPFVAWQARAQPGFPRKLLSLMVVALAAYLAAMFASDGTSNVGSRVVSTIAQGDSTRLMLMSSAWQMIQDRPLLGTGLGTFRLIYSQYRYPEEVGSAGGWVHNDYLQLWQEAGLPMLLLLLGVAVWVMWAGWRTLRLSDGQALIRMGYLAGICVILLHAAVNFLLYFSLVSLLLGVYLARVDVSLTTCPHPEHEDKRARPVRLAVGGYVLVLGILLVGQVAVEGLLESARYLQRGLLRLDMAYPRYEVAYWVSVLAPFHSTPQQVMGLELADAYLMTGGRDNMMRDSALDRMEAAWARAPCYLPYGNEALTLLFHGGLDKTERERAKAIVARNLDCNARHGLSYYYAGLLELPLSETAALEWWRAGLLAAPMSSERLLLAAAILSRTARRHEREMTGLATGMETSLRAWEANPDTYVDKTFWDMAERRVLRVAGKQSMEQSRAPVR